MNSKDEIRVVMAKKIAKAWLETNTKREYRMKVLNITRSDFPNLLRSARDKKIKLTGVDLFPDLGVQEDNENLVVWTSDLESLRKLKNFFERLGMETTFIW